MVRAAVPRPRQRAHRRHVRGQGCSAQEDTVGTRPGVCEDCTSSFVTAGLPG